jgi:hypothetical protein
MYRTPSLLTVVKKGAFNRPGKPTLMGYLFVQVVGVVVVAAMVLWMCRGP